MKIAVYTIAKNEEQFVKRWAESAKDADYLLIADTGSSDGTVELAKSLGINVVSISIDPWRFDISRNAALSLIPKDIDICIALDMDEVLIDGWRESLEKIKPETTRPRYKYTWSWNTDGTPGLQYGADKIHSRKGYRWKHPVHEVLVADRITEVQEWIDMEIHHYPDNTKSRGQYLPLLELAIREDPWDDRNAFYYARELFLNRIYDQAAIEFKRHLALPTATWNAERSASYRYLAKCDTNNAIEWLLKAIEEDPNRREAIVEYASVLYNKQDWAECYEAALDAIKIKEKPLDYLCEDFAWGALPYDLASISSWNMNMSEEAVGYIKIALEYEPNNQRFLNNLMFFEAALQNK